MKQLRILFLLLVAIVTQGAWAQGEPELTTGVIGVTCPSHEGSFGDDKLQLPESYKLYHFVPSVSGTLVIKNITGEPKMAVVGIFSSDYSLSMWAPVSGSFMYDLEQGSDYYIGFAPMYEDESLENEQFSVGMYCESCTNFKANFTYIERKESTCTTKGLAAHNICDECGAIWDDYYNFSDLASLTLPYAPHKFHAGECQNCDYVAQTITLTQNGSDYTFDGNVNYDLKSSVGENSNVSVFHIHTPAHGIVNVSAHVSKNEGRFDAYPPYLYFYQEGHVESQGYSTNMVYYPTLQCEDNLIANADYYLVVKNAEATNARLEVTLHPHETICIQERVNPTCAESGVKALYGCSTCDYYFTDEGDVVWGTDDQSCTIPALGHDFYENGVCSRCETDLRMTEGEYIIDLPARQTNGQNIEDYSYLRYFVAPRSGNMSINIEGKYNMDFVIFKKNSTGIWQSLESGTKKTYFIKNYTVVDNEEYIVGIRPNSLNNEIRGVKLTIKMSCEHQWQYFEEQESSCTEAGHEGYRYCTVCGSYYSYYSDVEIVPSVYSKAQHKFVDGVCTVCHYEVPTIELVKNEATGLYEYSNENIKFDLKSTYCDDDCSVFRVFIPEHGDINVKAYAYFDNDWDALDVIFARNFEYKESNYGGGVNASNKRNAAPVNHNVSIQTSVPCGCYMYILVKNNEVVESKLEVTLTPHEVECVQPHVDASCEDGMKAVFHCSECDMPDYNYEYYFTEDGIEDPSYEEVIIPGIGHVEDTNGICSVCGQKVRLADGENDVQFASGNNNLTAFKYTATQTKCLNVAVETDATIEDYVIMPWSQWKPSDNNDKPMSAPRKVGVNEEIEPLMSMNVVKGQEYAILFITTAEKNEDATITLSYSEIEYPVVEEGENTINIAAVSGNLDDNPEHYNIYKFVAPKSGVARFYTSGGEDTYCMLFDSDFNDLTDQDGNADNYYDFDFTWIVEEGETYYLGVRQYFGYSIFGYPLVITIEDLLEFEGTLELAQNNAESAEDYDFYDVIDDYTKAVKRPAAFSALGGVTYTRPMTNKWGTVVLPYELQSNDKVAYYELTAANIQEGKLEFTKVAKVAPNTPTVFRIISGDQYDASLDGPATIQVPNSRYPWANTKVDGWEIDGWYYDDTFDAQDSCDEGEGYMYISGDKFWHATGTLHMKPYRACFYTWNTNWSAAPASSVRITFKDDNGIMTTIESIMEENGEFTDVEAIYDLNGRQRNSIQRGVNIVRTADGRVRKFVKK